MSFTIDQLKRSLHITEAIEKLQAELASLLGGAAKAVAPKKSRRRKMSAAGRANIIAAQKARWAKIKQTEKSPAARPKISAQKKAKKTTAGKPGIPTKPKRKAASAKKKPKQAAA